MGIQTENSLKIVVVALFVAVTFAVAGLVAVTPFTGSSVVAQNDTGGNETGTANETALYSNQTGMAPETKR
jgi:flagellar basal body-associated protein FliL